jgi:hypothetical protein
MSSSTPNSMAKSAEDSEVGKENSVNKKTEKKTEKKVNKKTEKKTEVKTHSMRVRPTTEMSTESTNRFKDVQVKIILLTQIIFY